MKLLIFSVPALTILAGLANALPIEIPSIFKRDLNLTTTKSSCPANKAQLSCASSSDSKYRLHIGTIVDSSSPGNGTAASSSCCVESEGLIVQTQFWDTDVAGSPDNSWTIHGLWPDKCDGSYDSNCGFSDSVDSVSSVLKDAGETDLLDYMSQYWLNNAGSSDELYTHEFNKHGTCMSTLASSCYQSGSSKDANVVDWAKLTVKTFQGLPTYKWLSQAGITPSSSKTYSAEDITAALSKAFGKQVYIGCSNGALDQVWYFHKVKGSLLDDQLVKIDSVSKSTCSGSVKYLPRSSGKS